MADSIQIIAVDGCLQLKLWILNRQQDKQVFLVKHTHCLPLCLERKLSRVNLIPTRQPRFSFWFGSKEKSIHETPSTVIRLLNITTMFFYKYWRTVKHPL